MLTEYIAAAMERAEFKTLEDGTIFGEIPQVRGVWSNADTIEEAREELREVLEGWIILALSRNIPIPPVGGVEITVPTVA